MFFHKDKKNIQHKELRILKIDLINYFICLNKAQAKYYKEECEKFGYDILSIDKASQNNKQSFDISLEEDEDNFSNHDFMEEKKKKEKKKLEVERNHNHHNNSNKNHKYTSIEENKKLKILYNKYKKTDEFRKNNKISSKDLFKALKPLYNKIDSKKDKNNISEEFEIINEINEINNCLKEIKRRIENLSLTQIIEINNKFGTNNEDGKINIELNKLSQEQLKILKNIIEEYEKINAFDLNFINYKEEMINRPSDDVQVNIINNIDIHLSNDISDISDSDDDDESSLSNESQNNKKTYNFMGIDNEQNLNNDFKNENKLDGNNNLNHDKNFDNDNL